jgi:hypothetical protein
MSRVLNDERGSGAPRVLYLGTERSTGAREEKHPKGKLPGTMFRSREDPLASYLKGSAYAHSFAASLSPATSSSFSLFTLRQQYIFQMFVYSLL